MLLILTFIANGVGIWRGFLRFNFSSISWFVVNKEFSPLRAVASVHAANSVTVHM